MQAAESRGVLRLVVLLIACSSWCSAPHGTLAAEQPAVKPTVQVQSESKGLPPFVKKWLPAGKVLQHVPHSGAPHQAAAIPRLSVGQSDTVLGQWLVFALQQDAPGHFVVTRLWLQSYDAKQKAFFDAVMAGAPSDVAGEYQLQLTQIQGGQQIVTVTRFTHTTTTIYEEFAEDDSSGQAAITFLGEETEPADRIVVKVPLLQINPDLPVEAVVQHLPTDQQQALPIPPELLKTLGDHAQKSGSLPAIASLKRVFAPNLWMPEAQAAVLDGVVLESAGSDQSVQLLPVTALNNVDDPGRLNIVVVGFNMEPVDSKSLFQDIRNELLEREPVFQQNPAFANWWVLDKTYPEQSKPCSTKDFQLPEKNLLTDNLMHTMIVYVSLNGQCGNGFLRVGQQLGKSIRMGIGGKTPEWPLRDFSHEFGHALGGLVDEYETTDGGDKPKWPNCAATQQEGKQWWEALYPTMQFYAGCSFKPDNWRFFESGTMSASALEPMMFGNIHRWMLCEAVFIVTGATKGSYCTSLMGTAQGQYENSTAQCTDGVDNDTDGFVDCQDANCDGAIACPEENTVDLCQDGKDNDEDGFVDCQDNECKTVVKCPLEDDVVKCTDGIDNDANGLTDWQDAECLALGGAASVPENTHKKCHNTLDDDGDGLVDCADPDCSNGENPPYCQFGKETLCKDYFDNDGDGQYASHYIGLAMRPLIEQLMYAAYADKFETQQVEWPDQIGQSKVVVLDIKSSVYHFAKKAAYRWCEEWYKGVYPDVALLTSDVEPIAAEEPISVVLPDPKKNTPVKCSQNGCFSYMEQLQSIFELEELGDGSPNIFYQKQDQYEVFVFQCTYTLVNKTDCADPDCFAACGKNP